MHGAAVVEVRQPVLEFLSGIVRLLFVDVLDAILSNDVLDVLRVRPLFSKPHGSEASGRDVNGRAAVRLTRLVGPVEGLHPGHGVVDSTV